MHTAAVVDQPEALAATDQARRGEEIPLRSDQKCGAEGMAVDNCHHALEGSIELVRQKHRGRRRGWGRCRQRRRAGRKRHQALGRRRDQDGGPGKYQADDEGGEELLQPALGQASHSVETRMARLSWSHAGFLYIHHDAAAEYRNEFGAAARARCPADWSLCLWDYAL